MPQIPAEYQHLPKAVCCVIEKHGSDKILLVSRKDDPTAFGLPGGKVDPGETIEQAIIREVLEETGLTVKISSVIYQTLCPGHAPPPVGQDYYAFAFLATMYKGNIQTKESGIVKWGTWEDQKTGNFANYNKGVRAALEKLKR